MYPNSTRILVGLATTKKSNATLTAPALPLNEQTNVRIEAVGREVFIFYNSSLVAIQTMGAKRISGKAKVMISDPWYTPAKAKISSIQMEAITEFSARPIADFEGPISTGVAYEKTVVPSDFALSFSITPTGVVMGKTSIIHYTSKNSDTGGRMPG